VKPRLTTIAAAQILVLAGCLVMASAQSPDLRKPCIAAEMPTTFDYVVLAGIADSPYMLGMSAYNPARAGGTP
jgi:hypothetical protein